MEQNRDFETTSWDTNQVRQRKSRRKKDKRGLTVYLAFVFAVSAILAGVSWILVNDLCAFNKEYKEVTITVEAEDSLGSVSKQLKQEGLIEYRWFFHLFGQLSDAGDKIGSGVYVLNTNMDYRALIVGMKPRDGASLNAATVRITIPEGYTVQQIIRLLADKGVNSVSNLEDAAKNAVFDYDFIDNEALGDISRLEGYLFPDTYDFFVGENATLALNRLIANFDNKLTAEQRKTIEASAYSLKEILTIASLIEKETDGQDHSKIASVIYNRLTHPKYETVGLLQIDASLLYGLTLDGKTHEGALTNQDKAVDTPYNLYLHQGLPPTPIANPGLTSIQAAIAPENTSYYYYALGTDGKHHFTKTLAEHNQFLSSGTFQGSKR